LFSHMHSRPNADCLVTVFMDVSSYYRDCLGIMEEAKTDRVSEIALVVDPGKSPAPLWGGVPLGARRVPHAVRTGATHPCG